MNQSIIVKARYVVFIIYHKDGKNDNIVRVKKDESCMHKNLFIVTNGKKSWFLNSLKMLSDICRAYFEEMDQKEREEDYFSAIYNTLISSHSIPVISAQEDFAYRFPQVKCTVSNEPNSL